MINTFSTVWKDSWSIWTPVISINCHWNWTTLNSILKSTASTSAWLATNSKASTIFSAWSIPSSVRIFTLRSYSFCNDIFQSRWWPSTIASMISIWFWAINKLLLREVYTLTFLSSPRFHHTSCRESPTRSALSLIFYTTDHSFTYPINISSNIWSKFFFSNNLFFWRLHGVQINVDELFLSQNSELIDSLFVGLSLISIMPINFS